jgi:hypothetical protein
MACHFGQTGESGAIYTIIIRYQNFHLFNVLQVSIFCYKMPVGGEAY